MPKDRTVVAAEQRDRITEAAAVIAGWTRVWSRMLAEHIAGPDGRCRACPRGVHAAPRWPCRLATLAGTAQAIHLSTAAHEQNAARPRRAPGGSRCAGTGR